jgi:hypothetical protein
MPGSDTSGVSEHLRCAALLHAGKRCRSVAVEGTEFCRHHNVVAVEHGAEAVKRGKHLPARRKRHVQAPITAEAAAPTTIANGVADPPRSGLGWRKRPPPA